MAGLYFHIPFCRRRCHYCDFYFVTNTALTGKFLDAVETEVSVRAPLLMGQTIDTIYFGGGTPSMLTGGEIARLVEVAHRNFSVSPSAEITLEANPEDLTADTLRDFKLAGVSRLSLGTQAFTDGKLIALSRHHTAADALRCVELARSVFDNLSLDLIFGAAGETIDSWRREVEIALSLQPEHLSTYSLTIEPQTPLEWLISRGKIIAPVDELQSDMFMLAMAQLRGAGYLHYEVSNFALPGKESKHNRNYWRRVPYLGFGPSAHSFIGVEKTQRRFANRASLSDYLAAPANAEEFTETLSEVDIFNETLMLSLRQGTGFSMDLWQRRPILPAAIFAGTMSQDADRNEAKQALTAFLGQGLLTLTGRQLRMTDRGFTLADRIIQELFI